MEEDSPVKSYGGKKPADAKATELALLISFT